MLLAASPHKDSLRLVVQWIVTSKIRDWLIEQCVWQSRFENFQQAKEAVDKWIKNYNNNRPHQALGYLTPEKYYANRILQNLPEGSEPEARILENEQLGWALEINKKGGQSVQQIA